MDLDPVCPDKLDPFGYYSTVSETLTINLSNCAGPSPSLDGTCMTSRGASTGRRQTGWIFFGKFPVGRSGGWSVCHNFPIRAGSITSMVLSCLYHVTLAEFNTFITFNFAVFKKP